MSRVRGLAILLAAAAAPAAAQTVVTSAAPDDVDVTIYRAPGRPPGQEIELSWLEGYALISERRTVTVPAGESDIRFEGVAGGIVPQSAIVSGLPDGIVERNRDALLLSPASLLDRSLGRRIHLRRTSLATGTVREQEAIVRSSADGAVVLQTPDGFEALRCTGLSETPVYDSVPRDLSARPTLSVRTRSTRPVTATITLSYLADGFDWQADYVAQLSPDGSRVDLFAWLTLASMDETSFPDADTQAVAGRLNREESDRDAPEGEPLQLRCWPQGTTSDIPVEGQSQLARRAMRQNFGSPVTAIAGNAGPVDESIIVTGSVIARQEDLGDLKLYRIPEPVTVAANSQKQVAFLTRSSVAVDFVYRQRLDPDDDWDDPEPARLFLVTRNRTAEGLGVPLPGGQIALFAGDAARPILIGRGSLADRAVGEDVEIALGEAPGVTWRTEMLRESGRRRESRLIVSNDGAAPVRFEAEFEADQDVRFRPRTRLAQRDGRPLWAVDVPAHGTVTLEYLLVEQDG